MIDEVREFRRSSKTHDVSIGNIVAIVVCCLNTGVINLRIKQDFLIEYSCILHIRSNLLLL